MKNNSKEGYLVNDSIKYSKIRLINVAGQQLGLYSSSEALDIASKQGLDLVMISDKSDPPVCKIIDYGKHKFEQDKKAKETKRKQHQITVKEVKMRYRIENHDYQVRINQALRFLKSGDKVKITIIFKGREIQHFNLAINLLNKMSEDLKNISQIQQYPVRDGKNITMVLSPYKK